jgi:hypothetical protein
VITLARFGVTADPPAAIRPTQRTVSPHSIGSNERTR